jgi:hypothetical protein
MGKSYSAHLIDSPPFALNIEDLTAAWNRSHPDWQLTVPTLSHWVRGDEVKYDFLGDALTISEDGSIFVYRGEDIFTMFLEFYRDYLPAEYKLAVPLGYFGENGMLMIEKGFRAEDFEEMSEIEDWSEKSHYQVEIQPGKYPRKASTIYWQNPMLGVTDYAFTVDYPLIERTVREKFPSAALHYDETDSESCQINYRTALARVDFAAQTLIIADHDPDTTWELVQWYRILVPLEHRLNMIVRSWQTHTTKLRRVDGGVYGRVELSEISEIPYPTRSSLPREEFEAFLREVTRGNEGNV